jgi:hypothetical protein
VENALKKLTASKLGFLLRRTWVKAKIMSPLRIAEKNVHREAAKTQRTQIQLHNFLRLGVFAVKKSFRSRLNNNFALCQFNY